MCVYFKVRIQIALLCNMEVLKICIVLMLGAVLVTSEKREVKFWQCGGESGGSVTKMTADPCEHEPCQIPRGTNLTVTIDFTPAEDVEKPRNSVEAILSNGLPTGNFPGLRADACRAKNVQCPLKKGEAQTYTVQLRILPFFPTVEANATFSLRGPNKQFVMCAVVPVVVT